MEQTSSAIPMEYLLGFLGIMISVILFIITYRKTIGAKRERIHSANADVERTFLRNVAYDKLDISVAEVSRLLEGKARDYRVGTSDLYSESEVLNAVYTRIVESNVLTPDGKRAMLNIIRPVLESSEKRTMVDEEFTKEGGDLSLNAASIGALVMATIASILGGIAVTAPFLPKTEDVWSKLSQAFPVIGLSLAVLIAYIFYKRVESASEQVTTKRPASTRYMEFEREICLLIKECGLEPQRPPTVSGGDYIVSAGQRKVIIEVRAWRKSTPKSTAESVVNIVEQMVRDNEATEGVIVAPTIPGGLALPSNHDGSIRIVTPPKLKQYLKDLVNNTTV